MPVMICYSFSFVLQIVLLYFILQNIDPDIRAYCHPVLYSASDSSSDLLAHYCPACK